MSEFWKMVELKDGEPVVFLAVHALRWQPEWGEPKVGFIQIDEEEDELRAELARREARIAELEQERRWIPVGEKLPEKDGMYLCRHASGVIRVAEIDPMEDGYFYQSPDILPDEITHWMPLPEPPEEK